MVDEANIESHGMMDHKDGTLANYPDWERPFMERMSRMIARDRNYSAIVTWSMGNESGYGKHFETLYDYTKILPVRYNTKEAATMQKATFTVRCMHVSGHCAATSISVTNAP